MYHEKENNRIHYNVNLINNLTRPFFLFILSFLYQTSNKKLITTRNCLYKSVRQFKTVLVENEETFSYIKFFKLQLFLSFSASFGTQHQLTHPPVKSSTFYLRKMPILLGFAHRQTNFTLSWYIALWDSATTHSHSGKELNSSSQEGARFLGRFTSAYSFDFICVISIWYSASAHSPIGKELRASSQEDTRFPGRCTLAYNFDFIQRHLVLGLSNSSLTLR